MLESSGNTLYLTSSNSGEVMFGFKRIQKTDWSEVPKFKTVEEAFASTKPPFIVQGRLQRCNTFAANNFSGLVMVIENDSFPVLFYPVGGMKAFDALSQVGDEVSFVITRWSYENSFGFSSHKCFEVEYFKNLTTSGFKEPKTIALGAQET